MAGQREEYKAGGDRGSWHSDMKSEVQSEAVSQSTGSPLWSEDSVEVKGLSSGWLLCFSDLSAFTP